MTQNQELLYPAASYAEKRLAILEQVVDEMLDLVGQIYPDAEGSIRMAWDSAVKNIKVDTP